MSTAKRTTFIQQIVELLQAAGPDKAICVAVLRVPSLDQTIVISHNETTTEDIEGTLLGLLEQGKMTLLAGPEDENDDEFEDADEGEDDDDDWAAGEDDEEEDSSDEDDEPRARAVDRTPKH